MGDMGRHTHFEDATGPVLADASVVLNERIGRDMWRTVFSAPEIAARARPAQFIAVKVGPSADPFLRRPFSICMADVDSGTVEIVWAKIGRGTQLMTRWKQGEHVDLLGPLGNGFLPKGLDLFLVVAGGMGIAPVPFMLRRLFVSEPRCAVVLFYGTRSADLLYPLERIPGSSNLSVYVVTEDGTFGRKGLVTDALATYLKEWHGTGKVAAFACGPKLMLSATRRLMKEAGIPLYVSMEERMGCGIGLCRGCAVRALAGASSNRYFHVCTDGPVFAAEEVDLEG